MGMHDNTRPRIIDVTRKPSKCPVCGSEVWDIIYGTGEMTEADFLVLYRKSAIMGGDNIPRRPPIWCCSCGCKRFRKVNMDGTDAKVKVKLLKNVRKAPLTLIPWTSELASKPIRSQLMDKTQTYNVEIFTELGEKETVSVTAVASRDAEYTASKLVAKGMLGLKGRICVAIKVLIGE